MEVLSSAVSVGADAIGSRDELDPEEEGESDNKTARKKKNKRRKGIIVVVCPWQRMLSIHLN